MDSEKTDPEREYRSEEIHAVVKQICRYHIVFQLDNGSSVPLIILTAWMCVLEMNQHLCPITKRKR